MENSTFVLISGAVAFICVAYVELRVYQAYKQSRTVLLSRISDAEDALQEDILQLDKAELTTTKSGRELLGLLRDNNEVDLSHLQYQNMTVPKPLLESQIYRTSNFNPIGV